MHTGFYPPRKNTKIQKLKIAKAPTGMTASEPSDPANPRMINRIMTAINDIGGTVRFSLRNK